ncbi:MAG: insulinase family protein [Clostridia bacterium]|nr:insulinase family protein [Clostridia bacterium]
MEYLRKKLNNGLTLYSYQNSDLHSVTMAVVFPVDPNVLNKTQSGIYHYLEHLFFRRLGDIPQAQLYCTLECMGTTLRGVTYLEHICFYVTVLPKYCLQVFDILVKVFEEQKWNTSDLREERNVVVNQIQCDNYFDFYKIADRKYYQGTSYSYPIKGNISNTRFWTKSLVEHYRKKVFDVGRSGFIIAGAFDEKCYCSIVRKLSSYHSYGVCDFVKSNPVRFNQRNSVQDCFFYRSNYDVTDILMSFDISSDLNLCEVEFLSCILGEGDGSVLSISLRENLALTNEIYSSIVHSRNGNRLIIQCSATSENAKECIRQIFDVIHSFRKRIPERAFLMSKTFLTENRIQLYDNSYDLMNFFKA